MLLHTRRTGTNLEYFRPFILSAFISVVLIITSVPDRQESWQAFHHLVHTHTLPFVREEQALKSLYAVIVENLNFLFFLSKPCPAFPPIPTSLLFCELFKADFT